MNKLTKFSRAIFAIAMILSAWIPTLAHDFEVNGIYYNFVNKTAKLVKVSYKGGSPSNTPNEYTGSIIIPQFVTYNDTIYSVSEIGFNAFDGCTSLTEVTIPNSITSIRGYAFNGCTGLTSITIPNSITSIANNAFYGCSGLTSIIIPSSVTFIGNFAFDYCSSLKNVIIEDGYTNIELGTGRNVGSTTFLNYQGLFKDCPIETLYIGRNLDYQTSTNSYNSIKAPFSGIRTFSEVKVGDLVTTIGAYLFESCSNLSNIKIGRNVNDIQTSAFRNCSNLSEISFPDCITSIGDFAFENCTSLNEIVIPNSVTSIGNRAFKDCTNLTSVTIGKSVTDLLATFYNVNIAKVVSLSDVPPIIRESAFTSYTYANAILYVPYKCDINYGRANEWAKFTNIVELEIPKINLTLKFPESGAITHKEVYEEAVDLSFKANEGWEINNVTFNEEDVTAELDEDGNYTTPVLTADAILVVVFEKIDTSIEPISEKNDINVYAYNGEVRIVGAEPQSEVSIYNLNSAAL